MAEWRVISPADNWRNPLIVAADQVVILLEIAKSLGLTFTVDEAEKKLYLKMPLATMEPKVVQPHIGEVNYPSGLSLAIVDWKVMGDKYRPADLDRAASLVRWVKFEERPVSEHFKLSEFLCHDRANYGYVRLDPQLVTLLEKIRAEAGPLGVTSGYRPPGYQAKVNPGVTNSEHMNGTAADIAVAGGQGSVASYGEFYALCDRLNPNGGVGRYPGLGFVHVDVRGSRARWG